MASIPTALLNRLVELGMPDDARQAIAPTRKKNGSGVDVASLKASKDPDEMRQAVNGRPGPAWVAVAANRRCPADLADELWRRALDGTAKTRSSDVAWALVKNPAFTVTVERVTQALNRLGWAAVGAFLERSTLDEPGLLDLVVEQLTGVDDASLFDRWYYLGRPLADRHNVLLRALPDDVVAKLIAGPQASADSKSRPHPLTYLQLDECTADDLWARPALRDAIIAELPASRQVVSWVEKVAYRFLDTEHDLTVIRACGDCLPTAVRAHLADSSTPAMAAALIDSTNGGATAVSVAEGLAIVRRHSTDTIAGHVTTESRVAHWVGGVIRCADADATGDVVEVLRWALDGADLRFAWSFVEALRWLCSSQGPEPAVAGEFVRLWPNVIRTLVRYDIGDAERLGRVLAHVPTEMLFGGAMDFEPATRKRVLAVAGSEAGLDMDDPGTWVVLACLVEEWGGTLAELAATARTID